MESWLTKPKTKNIIYISALYAIFSFAIWSYTVYLSETINEKWSAKFVKKQVLFDTHRTLMPVLKEVAIAREMAKDKDIIQMALHEEDDSIKQKGVVALEKHRERFQDKSYFAAFAKTENYYFNDQNNSYAQKQYRYTLSKNKKEDRWFYDSISLNDDYQINVNQDTILGTTKVWINFLLKDNNKTIGLIGTGIDLCDFLKETVDLKQDGIRNILINKNMAIQLDRDKQLINYSSLTKTDEESKTLSLILKDEKYIAQIKQKMTQLENIKDDKSVKTLWLKINEEKFIVGIAYLKEVDWYNISIIDATELELVDNRIIFLVLTAIFIILLLINHYLYDAFVTKPLKENEKKLQIRVEDEVQSRIKIEREKVAKDEIVSNQMRFAFTSRVIENIIHQWKIPLVRFGALLLEVEAMVYVKKEDEAVVIVKGLLPSIRENMKCMQDALNEFYEVYSKTDKFVDFNIAETIKEAWKMLNAKAIASNMMFDMKNEDDISMGGYAHSFLHIMLILLDSSLDSARRQKIRNPKIDVLTKAKDGMVHIVVCDNCIKVNDGDADSIFTYKADDDEKNRLFVLGLNIVKSLVTEKFNGTITVSSNGDGVCFDVALPMSQP